MGDVKKASETAWQIIVFRACPSGARNSPFRCDSFRTPGFRCLQTPHRLSEAPPPSEPDHSHGDGLQDQ